jgi:hypothetical protein
VYGHSGSSYVAHESNTSATGDGKNGIRHNVTDIYRENKSAVNTEMEGNKHGALDILEEDNNASNNSGKKSYNFNFIHQNSSAGDDSTASPPVDTEGHFSNKADGAESRRSGTTRSTRGVPVDRLWLPGEAACRGWGFFRWLLQLKQRLWTREPQLLCLAPRCQVFSEVSGWILSPGYPRPYPNNVNSCYR